MYLYSSSLAKPRSYALCGDWKQLGTVVEQLTSLSFNMLGELRIVQSEM